MVEPDAQGTTPARPVALYEGPRVQLFRGWSLIALIVVCVSAGAGLHTLWPRIDALFRAASPAPAEKPRGTSLTQIAPLQLRGISAAVTLPPGQPTLVNVWLQGCQDCMPSFNAWRDLMEARAFEGAPIINVAYGNATEEFARQYHTGDSLVFDAGSALVQPLGISTFTTMVVDANGTVLLRDVPTSADFAVRMRTALAIAQRYDAIEKARALVGRWQGSYTCGQGKTGLTLDVSVEGGALLALFSFAALPDNPGVPSGSFTMRGTYDATTKRVVLSAEESDWIQQPPAYSTVDLDGLVSGALDGITGSVRGPSCTDFALTRSAAAGR